jgi:hypothetical protein
MPPLQEFLSFIHSNRLRAKEAEDHAKKALPVTFPNGDGEPFESSSPKLL